MEQLKPVVETNEDAVQQDEIRALKDLEMVLVGGGGDDVPVWP